MDYTTKKLTSESKFKISFKRVSDCNSIARVEFCSRLLSTLKPNREGIWKKTNSPRTTAYILGFPPGITWDRPEENTLVAHGPLTTDKKWINELKTSLVGFTGHKKSAFSPTEYTFSIKDSVTKTEHKYKFDNRSRALVAFCVIWDQKDHPRDHLEVLRQDELDYFVKFPAKKTKGTTKTYGDPSKTIDELRNQGFPRETDQSDRGTSIHITRQSSYNTTQEHYQLLNRNQSLLDKVGRSVIPQSYKTKLYELSYYKCNNCGETFPESYLSPDHRVPSIVKADNLSPHNFKKVLQTLCVRCNQVKRESCKKCPINHDCMNCAWAYPENHGISKNNMILLKKKSLEKSTSINNLLDSLLNKVE